MLQGTLAASAGLGQAIIATAELSPAPIRPATEQLAAQIQAGVHPREALLQFAEEVGDPCADRVVCSLLLAFTARAQRLGELLGALAESTREEVALRLRVETSRASVRSGVRTVVVFSVALRRRPQRARPFLPGAVRLAHRPGGARCWSADSTPPGSTSWWHWPGPPAPVRLLGPDVVEQMTAVVRARRARRDGGRRRGLGLAVVGSVARRRLVEPGSDRRTPGGRPGPVEPAWSGSSPAPRADRRTVGGPGHPMGRHRCSGRWPCVTGTSPELFASRVIVRRPGPLRVGTVALWSRPVGAAGVGLPIAAGGRRVRGAGPPVVVALAVPPSCSDGPRTVDGTSGSSRFVRRPGRPEPRRRRRHRRGTPHGIPGHARLGGPAAWRGRSGRPVTAADAPWAALGGARDASSASRSWSSWPRRSSWPGPKGHGSASR